MAAYSRPGVYIQETLNPIAPTAATTSASIGAFIGASDRGPVTPTYITSWSQYVNYFGGWNAGVSNDLPIAVFLFFANGGSQAYVLRVVGSGNASASKTLKDRAGSPLDTLVVAAANPGTWGNSSANGINVSITDSTLTGYFNLIVYFGGNADANIVERWTDLSMTATDSRYAITVINQGSKYITVTDAGSTSTGATRNPSTVANTTLSGGSNGTAVASANITAGLSQFDILKDSLLFNIPGYTDATTVNAAISYAAGRGDCFVIVDGLNDTVANQITAANLYTASSYAAVYYPRITIADPTLGVGAATGATKLVGAGGAVAGLYCATDASRGVFKSPAGYTANIAGAVAVASLSNNDLDNLHNASNSVNAIRYIPGNGITVMGARTLKAGYVDRYVSVRRTLIFLEKSFKDLTEFALFEPNDFRLWNILSSTLDSFLTSFWSLGGLSGATPNQAYYVKVDADNNPQSSVDNGELHIEIGVALQRPAEYVVIKIGQFNGSTTVTVA